MTMFLDDDADTTASSDPELELELPRRLLRRVR
jgi:hypothetical protein